MCVCVGGGLGEGCHLARLCSVRPGTWCTKPATSVEEGPLLEPTVLAHSLPFSRSFLKYHISGGSWRLLTRSVRTKSYSYLWGAIELDDNLSWGKEWLTIWEWGSSTKPSWLQTLQSWDAWWWVLTGWNSWSVSIWNLERFSPSFMDNGCLYPSSRGCVSEVGQVMANWSIQTLAFLPQTGRGIWTNCQQ